MKATNNQTKIYLYIRKNEKPNYTYGGTQSFEYGFVVINEDGGVRNPSDSSIDGDQAKFADLHFRCQITPGMAEDKTYAHGLYYRNVYSVELEDAERMTKMLRRIRKAEENFPVRPESFGQYVQLLCHALGVSGAVKATSEGDWHSEISYATFRPGEIQWLIDTRIGEFLGEHKVRMETESAR